MYHFGTIMYHHACLNGGLTYLLWWV
jgi:hypothetical protein